MKKVLIFTALLFVLCPVFSGAQHYEVYFADKGSNYHLLGQPYQILSAEAIENRVLRNIPLDETDLPVEKTYLTTLANRGATILGTSKWLNCAWVEIENPEALNDLPFVKHVRPSKEYSLHFSETGVAPPSGPLTYGLAQNQMQMVHGDYLHDRNLLGQGVTIAVLDGGFQATPGLHGLDSLRNSGRLKGTYNFITGDTNIYVNGSHGTQVLSVMAGFIPDTFAGSAVAANYWLFKTENELTETPVEMFHWLMAAEFADSVGVDIITSSLGYNDFDGTANDFQISDMDGNTTLVTKAADMAAAKGILVVVSAGNEGDNNWQRITAPADGDSVLAVGAVTPGGQYASFSSTGPTADGRIKPDVMAQGIATAFLAPAGPTAGNGTSFSCPVISGLAACLWQSSPSSTNMEIFEAIRSNASQSFTPENQLGYGIANFRDASWALSTLERDLKTTDVRIYPNPVGEEFKLSISGLFQFAEVVVTTNDLSGKPVLRQSFQMENGVPVTLQSPKKAGAYLIAIDTGNMVYLKKIIR